MARKSTLIQKMNKLEPVEGNYVERKEGRLTAYRKGKPYLISESRCKVCKQPEVRKIVDMMIAGGYKQTEILRHLEQAHNAHTEKKNHISYASINNHAKKHLSVEDAVVREILERRAAEADIPIDEGVRNIITPAAFAEGVVYKAHEKLTQDKLEITARDGLEAARTLSEFERGVADRTSLAEAFAQVEKIMEAVKAVCSPEQIRQISDVVQGRQSVVSVGQIEANIVEADLVEDVPPSSRPDLDGYVLSDPDISAASVTDVDVSGIDELDISDENI